MPDARTQRYVAMIAVVGVLTSCFGCGLLANNQVLAATVFLIVAQLIVLPLFVYLLVTRRRLKKVVSTRAARSQAELEALAAIGNQLEPTQQTTRKKRR